jgi:SAM-dependent methyltransferase
VIDITSWLDALHARHVAPYRPQEFTRALRALSARYVERRSELSERSALDSAGKRSAFAAFYGPLHYLTVREIVQALPSAARQVPQITDLGCGTGVGAAAWQHAQGRPAPVVGVDMSQWALEEARWNWRALGVSGRARRADLVSEIPAGPSAVLLAWAVNELPRDARRLLLPKLMSHPGQVLIIEPLARSAAPWWREWEATFAAVGGRSDEWKFRIELPALIRELSQRAGFHREHLGARSMWKP